MVCIDKDGIIKVFGLPRRLWNLTEGEKQPRHYALDKIDLKRFRVLDQSFHGPEVPRRFVVDAPTVRVICRYIYQDEDEEEVKKSWIKIKGLEL